ncbi:hypothetical protein HCA58_18325 [Micromonospora sp. HNM0581]|uniref:hypothetical protein n=1 Tax=Micromonospora sp. HNM0581 TaxID=2716341 RepID=UPI00146A03B5|nr:hypothetical protein [Micromonospora sp. HNM0581]NLU80300.1 hypothetical protein [Micromonospora sp. HNM0581]
MKRFPGSDARTVAVVAALAAFWLLAALLVGRRQDLLGVAGALLFVLLATVAGVAVTAARQRDPVARPERGKPYVRPGIERSSIDADTLEILGDREAVRAMRERRRHDRREP